MTKIHEVQEFEAWVRSVLVWLNVKEDVIDALIEDDVYLNEMKREKRHERRRRKNGRTKSF